MATRRLNKRGWAAAAGPGAGKLLGVPGGSAFALRTRLVVALAVCLTALVSAAPAATALAARPGVAASRAAGLAERRALVRREVSPAGEQAAGRAAEARLPAFRKPPVARLRQIAEQQRRNAQSRGAPGREVSPPPLSAGPRAPASPAASNVDGFAYQVHVIVPGGAVLTNGCVGSCFNDSMVTPGEPVTVTAEIWNDSDPPVSEPVQVAFQQLCGYDNGVDILKTVATATVTAPSLFGTATSGAPVSSSFNVSPTSCGILPIFDDQWNYQLDLSPTVVGGNAVPTT